MPEPGSRRGRAHDAEGARQTILDAAEEVFAEHGFDGARIDMIAQVSGYNKSLIFQYFDDKLGLYSAVIRRADNDMRVWQDEALSELREMELTVNAEQIRGLLRRYVGLYFNYLVEHPNVLRIYNWEMAERWQTFSKIWSERDRQDVAEFSPVFANIQKAGLMRAEPNPLIQYAVALFSCHTYLAVLSMYQSLVPEQDFDSAAIIEAGREFMIEFITSGLLVDRQAKKQPQPEKRASSRRLKGK
jgi:AcrR family transcriptional regulator